MEEKNKKIALLIIVLAVVVFILVILAVSLNKKSKKDSPNIPQEINSVNNQSNENNAEEEGGFQISEEKKATLEALKNITGKVSAVDTNSIEITSTIGEKISLNVPQKGVNIVKQTKQSNGSFLVEPIGLFDIPENKEVDVQYDSRTNELKMLVVK